MAKLGELKQQYEKSSDLAEKRALIDQMKEENRRLKYMCQEYPPFSGWLRIEEERVNSTR